MGREREGRGGGVPRSVGGAEAGFEELVVARCSLRRLGVACGWCVGVVCPARKPNSQKSDVKTGRGRFPESSWEGFFFAFVRGNEGENSRSRER